MHQRAVVLLFMILLIGTAGCDDTAQPSTSIDTEADPSDEDAPFIIPEEDLVRSALEESGGSLTVKWKEPTHRSFASIAAAKLGLDASRAAIISGAADLPDRYQSGLQNGFNQQWSHAMMFNGWGWHLWGDADDDFHDNIAGASGESESPEGYNGKSASYYYGRGNRDLGDWYLGYALHYIADVSFVLHTSLPDVAMLAHHFDYEQWVDANWNTGHNFAASASSVPASSYYRITNLKNDLKTAAKKSCLSLNGNAKRAWEAYRSSGYPTAAGSGSTDAVRYTRLMVEEAVKYTGGAIVYTMDRYGQW